METVIIALISVLIMLIGYMFVMFKYFTGKIEALNRKLGSCSKEIDRIKGGV